MTYTAPIAYPTETSSFDPQSELNIGPLALLLTNDSKPNPLYSDGRPRSASSTEPAHDIDVRLASTPALCTTSEEGAIFHALTATTAAEGRRYTVLHRSGEVCDADDATAAATPPGVLIIAEEGEAGSATRREWRAVLHYRGGFEADYVARFTVASLWCRLTNDGVATGQLPSDTSPFTPAAALEAAGWQARGTVIAMQGGGDAVARLCGPAAAEWEAAQLRLNPDRTFAHALARYPPQLGAVDLYDAASGAPRSISRATLLSAHANIMVRRVDNYEMLKSTSFRCSRTVVATRCSTSASLVTLSSQAVNACLSTARRKAFGCMSAQETPT
jgi:hypothetical protein